MTSKFSLNCFVFTHNDLDPQSKFTVSTEDVTIVILLKNKNQGMTNV